MVKTFTVRKVVRYPFSVLTAPRVLIVLCGLAAGLALGLTLLISPGGSLGPSRAEAQQAGPADDPSKPLVYVFSLDAQDGDRAIDAGEAPFLARLVRGEEGGNASYYRESRGIVVSETNPNHVAMATGAYTKSSGISGNAFAVYDAASKRDCPADGGSLDPITQREPPAAGTAQVTSGEAATCLRAETFFAALKRLAPDVVTAGIFGKPKLARIFETKRIDPASFDADHLYAPCEQKSDDPAYCKNDPIDPVQRYTDDRFVMDEVIRTIDQGVMADGRLRRPNLTFANFPDIDQVGHSTGARDAYRAQIGVTDMQMQRFVESQKAKGLWSRTVIVFTSDHSMDSTVPQPASAIETSFGTDADAVEIVLNGSVDMVYLKDRSRPDRHELLKRLRTKALTNTFVDEALYRQPNPADGGDRFTLDAVHPGWNNAGERTGDLFVTSKPERAFGDGVPGGINPLNGNHGAPQTVDNTFAIVSGGGQVRQQAIDGIQGPRFDDTLANPQQAEQVDIAPTVMALFGRRPPADSAGRVLTEAFAAGALPPVVDPGAGGGVRPMAPGGPAAPGTITRGPSCDVSSGFATFSVRPRSGGLRFAFARRSRAPVRVDVFRQSAGRAVLANRLVARFTRSQPFTWSGRGLRAATGDGYYYVRVRIRAPGGRIDERRIALRRVGGRFRARGTLDRGVSCGLLSAFKLDRTVFGGRNRRSLSVSFRLSTRARVGVEVLRGGRVVRRFKARTRPAGSLQRLRVSSAALRRGDHVIRLTATTPSGGRVAARRL